MTAKIDRTHVSGGYSGSTDYVITGTFDDVTEAVDGVLRAYPPAGYGTWFNWPPGKMSSSGKPLEYKKPKEIEPGIWRAYGDHSNSCD